MTASTDTATTAFVTLCDAAYWPKAERTIRGLRFKGEWTGDVVLIAVDFEPPAAALTDLRIQVVRFPRIPTEALVAAFKAHPLTTPTHDNRQFDKLTQWEKLHVFDPWFQSWDRIVFLDAGLWILDSVQPFLDLPWRGKFLAQDDTKGDPANGFRSQLELHANPEALAHLIAARGIELLDAPYFLNCMWIYDTAAVLAKTSKEELIATMNAYPIWRTNEMGVMNVVLHFQHGLWTPFPWTAPDGRYLFDWCESNHVGTTWRDYYALKYPCTGPPPPAAPRPLRIGLAVPCYKRHIPALLRLLDGLEAQVRRPDAVVVSCSSTAAEDFPLLRRYPFSVQVLIHEGKKNAAQNRNLAAAQLLSGVETPDYISFFDADDTMIPERLDVIAKVLEGAGKPDILLHSYWDTQKDGGPAQLVVPDPLPLKVNRLARGPTGCAIVTDAPDARIHHSQVTVGRGVLDRVKFGEGSAHETREDALFCGDVLALPGVRSVYVVAPLSIYEASGTGGIRDD